jgi:hypothetical protein
MLTAILTRLIDALALAGATLTRSAPPEPVLTTRREDEPIRLHARLRLGHPPV